MILRYDDYSSYSPLALERELVEILRRRRVSCAVGVIPFACEDQLDPQRDDRLPLQPEKVAFLKQAVDDAVVEPLLHGHAHRVLPRLPTRPQPSEFVGLELRHQRELLDAGKTFLESALGREIRGFAPPWNSYDLQTIRALEDLDFAVLSAGPRFGAVDLACRIALLPATCLVTSLRRVVAAARELGDPGSAIVALFHPYDFVEADRERGTITLDDFATTLDWLVAQDDLEATSFTAQLDAGDDLGARRFALNRSLKRTITLTPPWLAGFQGWIPGLYLSRSRARWRRARTLLLLSAFYVAAAALAAGISTYVVTAAPVLTPTTARLLLASVLVLTVTLTVLAGRRRKWTYKSTYVVAVGFGLLLGVLIGTSALAAKL